MCVCVVPHLRLEETEPLPHGHGHRVDDGRVRHARVHLARPRQHRHQPFLAQTQDLLPRGVVVVAVRGGGGGGGRGGRGGEVQGGEAQALRQAEQVIPQRRHAALEPQLLQQPLHRPRPAHRAPPATPPPSRRRQQGRVRLRVDGVQVVGGVEEGGRVEAVDHLRLQRRSDEDLARARHRAAAVVEAAVIAREPPLDDAALLPALEELIPRPHGPAHHVHRRLGELHRVLAPPPHLHGQRPPLARLERPAHLEGELHLLLVGRYVPHHRRRLAARPQGHLHLCVNRGRH